MGAGGEGRESHANASLRPLLAIAIFMAMKRVSIAEAKNHLPKLVHEAEEGRPVEIARRGKPVVVLVRLEDYERTTKGSDWSWVEEAARFRKEFGGLEDDWLPPREDFYGHRKPFSWR